MAALLALNTRGFLLTGVARGTTVTMGSSWSGVASMGIGELKRGVEWKRAFEVEATGHEHVGYNDSVRKVALGIVRANIVGYRKWWLNGQKNTNRAPAAFKRSFDLL